MLPVSVRSLWSSIQGLNKQFIFDWSLADHLLFSSITAQTLAETRPSVHGSPFPPHDPDTIGPGFPVPPDHPGKVSTSLFLIEFFKKIWAPIQRFARVRCSQTSLHWKLKVANIQIWQNVRILFCKVLKKLVPCECTAKEVSFEWWHKSVISFTDFLRRRCFTN